MGCDGDRICDFLKHGSTCRQLDHCSAAQPDAGRCAAIPSEIHLSPAGAGKIHPVDFAEARGARIEGVRIYDHRRGDFSVRTGIAASLIESGNVHTLGSGLPTIYAPNQETGSQAYVGTGAIVQLGSHPSANQFFGWDAAFRLEGAVKAHDNQAGGLGRETFASWKGTVGFLLLWAANELRGNSLIADGTVIRRYSTPFICIAPYVGEESTGSGFNFLELGNFCEGSRGPKIVVNGAGNQYLGNRLAWGSLGTVVAIGDIRGRCSGGPRKGLLCLDGAPLGSAVDCPQASCAFHADFRGGGGGHFVINDNLIHTDRVGRPARWIAAAPWKRCLSGEDRGKGCSTRSDCSGEAGCTWTTLAHFSIEDNLLYGGGEGDVGIDFSAITGLLPDGQPPLRSGAISGNLFQGQEFGIKLPPDPAAARELGISGTMSGVRAPLADWDWSMGDLTGLAGITRYDDQGQVVTLGAAEVLTRGVLVSASREISNAVERTDGRRPGSALGVVLNSPTPGGDAKVMLAGTASCIADGHIALGALVAASESVPGSVRESAGDRGAVVGAALEAAAPGGRFRCLIGPSRVSEEPSTPG